MMNVPLVGIGRAQTGVTRAGVERKIRGEKNPKGGDPIHPIGVVKEGEQYYIQSGHHRAAAAVLAGRTHIRAEVIESVPGTRRYKKPSVAKLLKSQDDEDLVLQILNELQVDDVSVDVVENISPELKAMFKDAGVFGVVQVGFEASPDITKHMDKAALSYAEDRGAELVTDLEKSTRDYMRTQVAAAIEQGSSAQTLADNIQESFAFSASRAETIARTELAFAHVQGNVEGWRTTGEVEMKESILGDNHEIEDECDDAVEAGAVPLDDDFGDTGLDFPPYHPNCVCDVLPVLTPSGDE